MTVAEAVADVAGALEAVGLHVAMTDRDFATPGILLRIGVLSDAGPPFDQASLVLTTVYAYYVPVRGQLDARIDADALDKIYAALEPITAETLTGTASSVSIGGEQWACYRIDAGLLGDAPEPAPLEASPSPSTTTAEDFANGHNDS